MQGILQLLVSSLALGSAQDWRYQTHLVEYTHRYLTAQLVPPWGTSTHVDSFSDWDQYGLGFCNFRMLNHVEQALLLIRVCSEQWDCTFSGCFSEQDFKMRKRSLGLPASLLKCWFACVSAHTELYLIRWESEHFFCYSKLGLCYLKRYDIEKYTLYFSVFVKAPWLLGYWPTLFKTDLFQLRQVK